MIFQKDEWSGVTKQAEEVNKTEIQYEKDKDFKVIKFEKSYERQPNNYFDLFMYTNLNELSFSQS